MQQDKVVNLGIVAVLGPNGGALVEVLQRFGSAAKAGLQVGDEILACDGNKLTTMAQWQQDLDAVGVGKTVTLAVIRAGATIEVAMPLFEKKQLSLEVKALEQVLERKISP